MSQIHQITRRVARFYLESHDFNGLPIGTLLEEGRPPKWRMLLEQLIGRNEIELVGVKSEFPHIKRRKPYPIDVQISTLKKAKDLDQLCLYPHPSVLEKLIDRAKYQGRPFTLSLALGTPQLEYAFFDLAVLERYRNDPRYKFRCDDLHGSLCISDDYFQNNSVPEKDEVNLEVFGFAYSEQLGRVVVAFPGDLSALSPEHQQYWGLHRVNGNFRGHEDFYRSQIIGERPNAMPICEAFFEELRTMNAMATAMNRPPLFLSTERPKRFGFLLRTTSHEFDQFSQLLDKTLSDNLNRKFFLNDVNFEVETKDADGRVRVSPKGTITALDEWLRKNAGLPNPAPIERVISAFREVRGLRNPSAHKLSDDRFDPALSLRQRELIEKAYRGIQILRMILSRHPATKRVELNQFIRDERISVI